MAKAKTSVRKPPPEKRNGKPDDGPLWDQLYILISRFAKAMQVNEERFAQVAQHDIEEFKKQYQLSQR